MVTIKILLQSAMSHIFTSLLLPLCYGYIFFFVIFYFFSLFSRLLLLIYGCTILAKIVLYSLRQEKRKCAILVDVAQKRKPKRKQQRKKLPRRKRLKRKLRRKRNDLSHMSPQAAGGKHVVNEELEVIISKTALCR